MGLHSPEQMKIWQNSTKPLGKMMLWISVLIHLFPKDFNHYIDKGLPRFSSDCTINFPSIHDYMRKTVTLRFVTYSVSLLTLFGLDQPLYERCNRNPIVDAHQRQLHQSLYIPNLPTTSNHTPRRFVQASPHVALTPSSSAFPIRFRYPQKPPCPIRNCVTK